MRHKLLARQQRSSDPYLGRILREFTTWLMSGHSFLCVLGTVMTSTAGVFRPVLTTATVTTSPVALIPVRWYVRYELISQPLPPDSVSACEASGREECGNAYS